MGETLKDLQYGLRMYVKAGFAAIIMVMTLALGIGASTAVFSLVNAILLKRLPYPQSDRIVMLWHVPPPGVNIGFDDLPWGQMDFDGLVQETKGTFRDLGAFKADSFNLTHSGEPELLDGIRASAGFFPALGISPALGRTFLPGGDEPGNEHEVILSDRLWRDRFQGDPGIIGRALALNGATYTVVGVMPPGFGFPYANEMPGNLEFAQEAQLWVPLVIIRRRGPAEFSVVARLQSGIGIQQARAAMAVFAKHDDIRFPDGKGWFNSTVTPLAQQVAGDTRRPLLLMLCAVGIVLLIACSNIANLLLARSVARRREFIIRSAIGAGRGRLVRQLLTESVLLAMAAGLAGLLLAEAGIRCVKIFGPSDIPRLRDVGIDLRVFLFAFGISILTGILFGLAPTFGIIRENLAESLREGGQRAGASTLVARMRSALVVVEVALALTLLIAGGLLTRSFFRLLKADPGFTPAHVLTFELSLPKLRYPHTPQIARFYDAAIPSLQSVPGVQSAAIAEAVPLGGATEGTVFLVGGRPAPKPIELPVANYTIVSPTYFSTVGTPLLRGRYFLDSDTESSSRVAVINLAMANRYWPREDPIRKTITIPSARSHLAIVGVVANQKHISMRENPGPEMYVPYRQNPWPSMSIMQVAVHTQGDPLLATDSIRRAIHSIDPDLPVAKVTTLSTLVNNAIKEPRFAMVLLGAFGALALLLALIGMYAVVSYSVMQRLQEIGTRMAIGAQPRDVFQMVLGQGARLAGLGILIGLAASAGGTRIMMRFLYGVQPLDVLTFSTAPLFLIAVVVLACYWPARRAMRVDPMVALRYE